MKKESLRINNQKIQVAVIALILVFLPLLLGAQLEPTPFVGRGPFFPHNAEDPMDNDLTKVVGSASSPKGEIIELRGTIRNAEGELIDGADVLIWQTDNDGNYDHPDAPKMMGKDKLNLDPGFQYWGKTVTDKNGNYYFKTIKPQPYLVADIQRPAHIHFRVKHEDYKHLTMELHFPNDEYLENDRITAHLDDRDHIQLMARITTPPAGYGPKIAGFNIVMEKK